MSVPFGFSAGDLVMAVNVIAQVAQALRETGGASSEYQETFHFMEGLVLTLQHLQHLNAKCTDPSLISAIRTLTKSAEKPIREFINDIQKFDSALGSTSQSNRFVSGVRKAEWVVIVRKRVDKLRGSIASQMQPIHLLLESQNL